MSEMRTVTFCSYPASFQGTICFAYLMISSCSCVFVVVLEAAAVDCSKLSISVTVALDLSLAFDHILASFF